MIHSLPAVDRPIGRSIRSLTAGWTATPPALLPPRVTSDGTHRRILEAALVRFGEQSYHEVSIRELAEAAGITKSSVYSHISAKEDLLAQLMLLGHEEHQDQLRDAILRSPNNPRDQLAALVGAHVRFHATYTLLARVGNQELHALSAESARRVFAVREHSSELLLNVVQRGIDEGVFHVGNPWLAVAAIGAIGIRVAEWYLPESGFTVDEVADAYTEYALKIVE